MRMLTVLLLAFLILPAAVQAEVMVFQEKYTYDASEADSKLSCRAISLLEVKRLLVEKLGTYVESVTEVKNYRLTSDEVVTLSAGIVRTEIIAEEWDGKSYTLTAKIEADPDLVAKTIGELYKNREGAGKIEELQEVNEKYLAKMQEMKDELAEIQNNFVNISRDYGDSAKILGAWELFEQGLQHRSNKNFGEAIAAFSEAIKINPKIPYYLQRGKAYMGMKQFKKAIDDFNEVISLNPGIADAYYDRGRSLRKAGSKKQGSNDIKKAAKLGSGKARMWLEINN